MLNNPWCGSVLQRLTVHTILKQNNVTFFWQCHVCLIWVFFHFIKSINLHGSQWHSSSYSLRTTSTVCLFKITSTSSSIHLVTTVQNLLSNIFPLVLEVCFHFLVCVVYIHKSVYLVVYVIWHPRGDRDLPWHPLLLCQVNLKASSDSCLPSLWC